MPNSSSHPFWCVSVNPAIDKRMRVSELIPGGVNRVREMRAEPGGKAAHVAMVLQVLGVKPTWLGFAGGLSGDQLLNGLRTLGISAQPVIVNEETRVNLEIIDNNGGVTELLEPGPTITDKDEENLLGEIAKLLSREKRKGIVIASGSLPPGADTGFYATLTRLAHAHGHKMFLDTSGEPLRLALGAGPDLIKPNREEAESLTGEKIGDPKAAGVAVAKLIARGARSAVITLGEQGLVWSSGKDGPTYHARTPNVKAISAVGSGDATVAAFAYVSAAGLGVEETLKLAAACGAANCLAEAPGRMREADISALEPQVSIEKLQ